MLRITLNFYNLFVFHVNQHAAGIVTVVGTRRLHDPIRDDFFAADPNGNVLRDGVFVQILTVPLKSGRFFCHIEFTPYLFLLYPFINAIPMPPEPYRGGLCLFDSFFLKMRRKALFPLGNLPFSQSKNGVSPGAGFLKALK
ncbi:MAG: hypothetical protein ACOX8R_05455 [Bacillota bacterium]